MLTQRVDVAMIGDDSEALALRGDIEQGMGIETRLIPIATASDLVDLVSAAMGLAPMLVLSCHGDSRSGGILLPYVDPAVRARDPFHGVLTPELVRAHARLSGCEVVSTGCGTGSREMGEAFVAAGAAFYVAPYDYPSGPAAFMMAVAYLHSRLIRNSTPDESASRAWSLVGGADEDWLKVYGPIDA